MLSRAICQAQKAMRRLCLWRAVLTVWHLGPREFTDPGVRAMMDLQECRLVTRAEVSALVRLLIAKGVFTRAEFADSLNIEADILERQMQVWFPGYRATDDGMEINRSVAEETHRAMGFPS